MSAPARSAPPFSLARLAEAFTSPDAATDGPVPIWWWSGAPVDLDRLTWQMQQLVSQGVSQAVVMNLAPSGPLYGALADDPPFFSDAWWDLFLGACGRAAEVGFRLWPYDQVGFSGANFQGRLTAQEPAFAGLRLARLQRTTSPGGSAALEVPEGVLLLGAWHVGADGRTRSVPTGDGTPTADGPGVLTVCFAQEKGFDYFDTTACAALLDTVHGEFDRRASQWFGSVIPGFFQDELPDVPTWGREFAATFLAERGYDLLEHLPALWGDPLPAGASVPAEQVRVDYHAHRAECSLRAFFAPLSRWFADRGLECGFDQQTPAREGDPAGSVALYGDYTATHAGYSTPGSDHWGDPKLHSSLAQAHGGARTWIEAFHSSGWGGTLEETYDWLAPFLRRGATLYDPHAVYYATPGGWWEWAPPSTCWRQPYWPAYHRFAAGVTRLCGLLRAGDLVADVVLLFPTAAAQAGTSLTDTGAPALATSRSYHSLNGRPTWFTERRGVLERAGLDHSVFDESVLVAADLVGDRLQVGGTSYRTVVLPRCSVLPRDLAARLVEWANAGGRVVLVGAPPTTFTGPGEGDGGLLAAVASGVVHRVEEEDEVPDHVLRGPVQVEADAPCQLRRVGDAHVVALFAHDERTGTRQPMMPDAPEPADSVGGPFDYWAQAARGYEFRPVTDRAVRVVLRGTGPDVAVQRWDPRTGDRRPLPHTVDGGAVVVETDFSDGSVAVLLVGPGLPDTTGPRAPAATGEAVPLPGPWTVEARSRLDNRWGDLGPASDRGVVPLQVWRLEAAQDDDGRPGAWSPAIATHGPFVEVHGPGDGTWRRAELSLSRGLRSDPREGPARPPRGFVPEEFLQWADVPVGATVGVRTTLEVPREEGLHLVVGASAAPTLLLDGAPAALAGDGYWSSAPLAPGRHRVEISLTARTEDEAGVVRGSFAVVRDLAAYRRPEWLVPADGSVQASTVVVRREFALTAADLAGLTDARVQVGTEQPSTVVLNGVEIGRQSAFDPYERRRSPRIHPYDVRYALRAGTNVLEVHGTDTGLPPAVLVDSPAREDGGLGVVTGQDGWQVLRRGADVGADVRRLQGDDPRFACLVARPHPLPGASWLEAAARQDAVVAVVPDVDPDDVDDRWLRFDVPVGAVALHVPTGAAFAVDVDGASVVSTEGGTIRLGEPATAGTTAVLRFDGRTTSRRGGAVLEGPVAVEVAPVEAPLLDWTDLGLHALGGEVSYRSRFATPAGGPGWELDLGVVRGAVEVVLDGEHVDHLVWSPYRIDLTDLLGGRGGEHELEVVVRGGLAGYLSSATPTPSVFGGQDRGGLQGPVVLRAVSPA